MHRGKKILAAAVESAGTISASMRDGASPAPLKTAPLPAMGILLIAPLLGILVSLTAGRSLSLQDAINMQYVAALPAILLCVSATLGAVYRQTRITFLSLFIIFVMVLSARHIIDYESAARAHATAFICLFYTALMIPVFFHAGEQGLLNGHGAIRLLIVFSAVPGIILFSRTGSIPETIFSSRMAALRPLPGTATLSLFTLGLILVALAALLFRNRKESPYLGPILGCCAVFILQAFTAPDGMWGSLSRDAVYYLNMCGASIAMNAAVVESLRHMAHMDELTELPSRRSMNHYTASLTSGYSVAMIDIDHFKRINDTYGHETGDQVLRYAAYTLAKFGPGRCFRYGGEEFSAIQTGERCETFIEELEDVRLRIQSTPFIIRSKDRPKRKPSQVKESTTVRTTRKSIRISVSIGVAHHAETDESPLEVIDRADKALYRAKTSGRNCIRIAK